MRKCRYAHSDLGQYPDPIVDCAGLEVTLGDLHGNAKKLLYFLVKHGVVQLSRVAYLKFCSLYDSFSHEFRDSLNIKAMLAELQFNSEEKLPRLVRLIGDVLSDRGQSDYVTLLLLEQLRLNSVPYVLMLSNHDVWACALYSKNKKIQHALPRLVKVESVDGSGDAAMRSRCVTTGRLKSMASRGLRQQRSMVQLECSIQEGKIDREEVTALFYDNVVPALRLIDSGLSEDGQAVVLFSHAPVPFGLIVLLANEFNVKYEAASAQQLSNTVNQLNRVFHRRLRQCPDYFNRLCDLWNRRLCDTENNPSFSHIKAMVKPVPNIMSEDFNYLSDGERELMLLHSLCWNRRLTLSDPGLNMPEWIEQWVHGHTGPKGVEVALYHRDACDLAGRQGRPIHQVGAQSAEVSQHPVINRYCCIDNYCGRETDRITDNHDLVVVTQAVTESHPLLDYAEHFSLKFKAQQTLKQRLYRVSRTLNKRLLELLLPVLEPVQMQLDAAVDSVCSFEEEKTGGARKRDGATGGLGVHSTLQQRGAATAPHLIQSTALLMDRVFSDNVKGVLDISRTTLQQFFNVKGVDLYWKCVATLYQKLFNLGFIDRSHLNVESEFCLDGMISYCQMQLEKIQARIDYSQHRSSESQRFYEKEQAIVECVLNFYRTRVVDDPLRVPVEGWESFKVVLDLARGDTPATRHWRAVMHDCEQRYQFVMAQQGSESPSVNKLNQRLWIIQTMTLLKISLLQVQQRALNSPASHFRQKSEVVLNAFDAIDRVLSSPSGRANLRETWSYCEVALRIIFKSNDRLHQNQSGFDVGLNAFLIHFSNVSMIPLLEVVRTIVVEADLLLMQDPGVTALLNQAQRVKDTRRGLPYFSGKVLPALIQVAQAKRMAAGVGQVNPAASGSFEQAFLLRAHLQLLCRHRAGVSASNLDDTVKRKRAMQAEDVSYDFAACNKVIPLEGARSRVDAVVQYVDRLRWTALLLEDVGMLGAGGRAVTSSERNGDKRPDSALNAHGFGFPLPSQFQAQRDRVHTVLLVSLAVHRRKNDAVDFLHLVRLELVILVVNTLLSLGSGHALGSGLALVRRYYRLLDLFDQEQEQNPLLAAYWVQQWGHLMLQDGPVLSDRLFSIEIERTYLKAVKQATSFKEGDDIMLSQAMAAVCAIGGYVKKNENALASQRHFPFFVMLVGSVAGQFHSNPRLFHYRPRIRQRLMAFAPPRPVATPLVKLNLCAAVLMGALSLVWAATEGSSVRSLKVSSAGVLMLGWAMLLMCFKKPCQRYLQYRVESLGITNIDQKLQSLSSSVGGPG